MSLAFFNRRVPGSVSLPIIVVCGAVGFVASTMSLGRNDRGAPQIQHSANGNEGPVAHVEEAPGNPLSAASTPPRDAVILPVQPPVVPTTLEREKQVTDEIVKSAPLSSPVTKTPPQRTRSARPERPASSGHRAQRIAQPRSAFAKTSSASLKNMPLIGPMFSLLQ